MIRFEQFSWHFADAAAPALSDVSLHIQRGEFVAIAGPSGSGKSTLALAMCGLLMGRHPGQEQGRVRVDGHDVAATPLHQMAETIALVQQNPETHFATLTVRDELAFGLENRCWEPERIRAASRQAMELLSITQLEDRDLATLSGGEKQRVAVASIVAGEPLALVLDEPTASLDPEASERLFRALADLCRQTGLTVVIIEHKLAQLLPHQPHLIGLEKGRVVVDRPDGTVPDDCPSWLAGPGPASRRVAPAISATDVPLVNLSEVTVELGGQTVLQNVSVPIRAGEVVALLGPNGGGKSTLLHCIQGLTPLAGGSIQVCDLDVSPAAVSRLARLIGLVFQNADHQLVADTVWAEALFAVRNQQRLDDAVMQEATRLLEQAGLVHRKGDHPFRLSWGEKRRLNVISAMLHQPRLLLLDEPFAGQDWENAAFLLEVMRAVVAGADDGPPRGTCLLVTHDPRIVLRGCTRALFLSNGRVVVDAPVPEVFDRLKELGHRAYVPTPSGESV